MKQYIDKSALVAEIEKRIKECDKLANAAADNNLSNTQQANELLIRQYTSLLHFLDTLEVKEVEDEKCKEYDKALSIAKAWYKSSDSSAQERNVARMIMGDKVREEL